MGKRKRIRELGIEIGYYPVGKYNAITDVEGVKVGHVTLIMGEGRLIPGKGPVRTGVTAIIPNDDIYNQRLFGGGAVINGAGELTGYIQTLEWGVFETPLVLTNSLGIGACYDGVIEYMSDRYPSLGISSDVILPVIGECNDSVLNDIQGRHITPEHVYNALKNAVSGPVPEGSVGGGTGMLAFEFKGGIGTSSRIVEIFKNVYTVGVLIQSNLGRRRNLRLDGMPVGKYISGMLPPMVREGSAVTIIATDAPLLPNQLNRLSRRAALGLARVGSFASNNSGETVFSFSTANKIPRRVKGAVFDVRALDNNSLNPLFEAVADAVEEAVLNSMFMADTMVGRDNNTAYGIPVEKVMKMINERK
jgi:D-aminopeptidase